jgi:hypothetical protein
LVAAQHVFLNAPPEYAATENEPHQTFTSLKTTARNTKAERVTKFAEMFYLEELRRRVDLAGRSGWWA